MIAKKTCSGLEVIIASSEERVWRVMEMERKCISDTMHISKSVVDHFQVQEIPENEIGVSVSRGGMMVVSTIMAKFEDNIVHVLIVVGFP
ncbi:hypothetical protein L1987_38778 [Smallanthus sonchifolius]|uniref:Uncharacterized protein n=1 Tax=Smallanthus sonchifolius TaxID=185202 RepID=A0ACB9HK70_9ASTR|nr:hypothetical protein L1987_38778 [Smallanthus sonchifolius]